jgi:hypothetical protein
MRGRREVRYQEIYEMKKKKNEKSERKGIINQKSI